MGSEPIGSAGCRIKWHAKQQRKFACQILYEYYEGIGDWVPCSMNSE